MSKFVASAMNEKHVRLIADALNACSVGKTVTHHQITRAIGKQPLPGIVQRARKLANQESGAVFRSVRGVGYERMAANQAASLDNSTREHTRRCYRNATRMISNAMAKANDLTKDEIRRGCQAMTHLGLLEAMARDRAAPKIPEGALPTDPGHTVRETLESMRAALGRG